MRLSGKPSLRRALLVIGLGLIGGAACLVVLWPSCVAAGTLVDTPAGPRAIETLIEGDAVWTEGPSGERQVGRVLRAMAGWSTEILEIATSDGGTLRATALHPIATPGGWTPAGTLKAGDLLRRGAVVSVARRTSLTRVYDLEVEPNSNFYASGVLVHNKSSVRASNERNAKASLKTLASAEHDFFANDRDGNKIQDFWVGDVASLYTLEDSQLIELSVAEADAAPLKPGTTKPKAGYVYGVIPERTDGTSLGADTDRDPKEFAFCAWPATYGPSGRMTFIIREDGIVWRKDTGRGARLLRWPKDPAADGWERDF